MNTDSVTVTNTVRIAALNALVAESGLLDEAKLILFTNPSVTETTPAADLVEAAYTGYAAKTALTWSTPIVDDDGILTMYGGSQVFAATGSAATAVVTGWAMVNTGKTVTYAYGVFDEEQLFGTAGDGVIVVPRITYPR